VLCLPAIADALVEPGTPVRTALTEPEMPGLLEAAVEDEASSNNRASI
jgi:hypothetical protein